MVRFGGILVSALLLINLQGCSEIVLSKGLKDSLVTQQPGPDQMEVSKYAHAIIRQIGQNWVVPANAKRSNRVVLRMQLLPTGDVAGVVISSVSGNPALDGSAEQAVHRAQPFAVPKDPLLFEKMRIINIEMSPENLHW